MNGKTSSLAVFCKKAIKKNSSLHNFIKFEKNIYDLYVTFCIHQLTDTVHLSNYPIMLKNVEFKVLFVFLFFLSFVQFVSMMMNYKTNKNYLLYQFQLKIQTNQSSIYDSVQSFNNPSRDNFIERWILGEQVKSYHKRFNLNH